MSHSLPLLQKHVPRFARRSLVNMVLNRKALAYTSKRPGKTQQFNYFSVNDKLDKKKEVKFGDQFPNQAPDSDSFYIVDLPGFGYAKVPEKQRLDWENFMRQVSERSERALGVFWTAFDKSLQDSEDSPFLKFFLVLIGEPLRNTRTIKSRDIATQTATSTTELTYSTIFARSLHSCFIKNSPRFALRSFSHLEKPSRSFST